MTLLKRAISSARARLVHRHDWNEAFSNPGGRLVRRRRRYYFLLMALVVAMFSAEFFMHYTQSSWPPADWTIAAIALLATALAVGSGLRADDLGLAPATMGRGLKYSAAIVGVVVAVIAAGIAIPATREMFQNDAYRDLGPALFSAGVLIPSQTVIPEELLFRGVLLGGLLRRHTMWVAIGVQAMLFGLWHVISSTGLSTGNAGIGNVVGDGPFAAILGVLGAVLFTGISGVVFGWLRVRTGSILPAIALHWAANGAGAIASALAWTQVN